MDQMIIICSFSQQDRPIAHPKGRWIKLWTLLECMGKADLKHRHCEIIDIRNLWKVLINYPEGSPEVQHRIKTTNRDYWTQVEMTYLEAQLAIESGTKASHTNKKFHITKSRKDARNLTHLSNPPKPASNNSSNKPKNFPLNTSWNDSKSFKRLRQEPWYRGTWLRTIARSSKFSRVFCEIRARSRPNGPKLSATVAEWPARSRQGQGQPLQLGKVIRDAKMCHRIQATSIIRPLLARCNIARGIRIYWLKGSLNRCRSVDLSRIFH